jgi:hypothetical protein
MGDPLYSTVEKFVLYLPRKAGLLLHHLQHLQLEEGLVFLAPEPIIEIEPKQEEKGLAFSVDLPQYGSGISWSSDLSFRWIYVHCL